MIMENFKVIDENLITKLSLRSGSGFLTLIDAEINAKVEPNGTFQEEKHTIINYCNKLAEKESENKEYSKSFEKYQKDYPNDKQAYGGWVLEQDT